MIRSIVATVLLLSNANAFQTAPRIRSTCAAPTTKRTWLFALNQEKTFVSQESTTDIADKTEEILLASNLVQSSSSSERPPSFDLDSFKRSNKNDNWIEGAAWRGVVGVLCALWASNFAAAKIILAEPGVDSSLYAVSRFAVAALALAPFAINAVRKTGIDAETVKGAAVCGSWVAFGTFLDVTIS